MLSPLAHDDPYRLGAYQLLARMGSGGMGTVYLARLPGGRTVALKTMHARIAADTAFRTRFRLETDAARVIGGRYGAQVVDADVVSDTPWLATEYVLGPPLGDAVGLAGPLPEPTVRALGAALCQALGQLHRSDVVHRDLKPSNLLVTAHGPKVIDFGIARALGDDRLTSTGAAAGTPAFMSPEQALGQEHTSAGDVFALAGVLVFAASGHGPFGEGQPADLLYRVRFAEADLTGVPEALVPVLSRCLDKEQGRRPGTAQLAAQLHDGSGEFADHLPPALLAEIGRLAAGVWQLPPARLPAPVEPGHEPGPAATAAAGRKGLSRRALLAVGGGGVLAVAAGAGTGAWLLSGQGDGGNKGPGGQAYEKPSAGPSVKPLPKKKLDSTWQIQVAGPSSDLSPALPLAVRDLVVITAGKGLGGIKAADGNGAKGGGARWVSDQMERIWQLGTDGKSLYRMVEPSGSEGNAGKPGGFPLPVASVDLATGKAREPLAKLTEFNGVLDHNQLLCVADGVLYMAAGEGKYSIDGFLHSQSWSVFALDAGTGRKKWSQPLPARKDGSNRLHFLDAAVAGGRLVAFQERNDGSVRVVALDPRTGKTVWDHRIAGADPDRLRGRLTVDGEHVYLGGSRLRALRLSDGEQEWSARPSRTGRSFGPPSVEDGVVYAVEEGLGLIAHDAGSGRLKWRERGGYGAKAKLTDRPVIGSEYAYSVDTKGLRAVNLATHAAVRTYKTTGTRFVAHQESKVVIALGGHFLAAFPLR